jgi:hypothetical protein
MKLPLSSAMAIVLTIIAFSAPSSAYAGVFYQYTGKTFTYTDPILGTPWAGARISALVEISAPNGGLRVGAGCNVAQPCAGLLDSWSLSAGPWTITDSTPTVDDITPFFVTLSADANTIDFWQLAAFTGSTPFENFLETTFDGRVPPDSTSSIDLVFQFGIGTLARNGPNDPGTWERLAGRPEPDPSAVPEPSTILTFLLGLSVVVFMRRRRMMARVGAAGLVT